MNHEMKLFSEPFILMKSGKKTIEIRLNDEKRQLIKIGDTITFHKLAEESETLTVDVLDLIHFNTFEKLYRSIPFEVFGCAGKSMQRMIDETYKIYTPERETRYGVLGIKVRIKE